MRLLIIAWCLGFGLAFVTPAPAQDTALPDDFELELTGNRFRPLEIEELTAAQKTMVAHILEGPRTALGGPFNVLLRSPELGDLAQALGAYARYDSSLPATLREIAIIMTARFWRAEFEWYAHKNAALAAGLDPAIVEAVRNGRRPQRMAPDEAALYALVDETLNTHRIGDATFAAALEHLGERGIVDAIGTVGYYSLVSMLLNVDDYPLPEGVQPELGR
jgi:4-carboxymuconolactone decarboxylase